MRERKFRARDDSGELHYFGLFDIQGEDIDGEHFYIKQTNTWLVKDSVEEWIGRTDKTGKDIYEGDFCNYLYMEDGFKTTAPVRIVFLNGCYCFVTRKGYTFPLVDADISSTNIEVTGNTTDNPELISGS